MNGSRFGAGDKRQIVEATIAKLSISGLHIKENHQMIYIKNIVKYSDCTDHEGWNGIT